MSQEGWRSTPLFPGNSVCTCRQGTQRCSDIPGIVMYSSSRGAKCLFLHGGAISRCGQAYIPFVTQRRTDSILDTLNVKVTVLSIRTAQCEGVYQQNMHGVVFTAYALRDHGIATVGRYAWILFDLFLVFGFDFLLFGISFSFFPVPLNSVLFANLKTFSDLNKAKPRFKVYCDGLHLTTPLPQSRGGRSQVAP